tara:strand:- start:289 stop:519 length:231 start_codon:yes stop_codon:yes gene_type:complete
MNTNYYLNKLSKRMSDLEKKITLLEKKLEAPVKVNKNQEKVLTKIRPMTDEERGRATERKEINQVWYNGDGGELFE